MNERGFDNLNAALLSGVQGHWDFEGVLTDASGNGFTLTHSGTARYATINSLRGVYLRSSDSLTRANEAALEITGTLTLHMLVYFNSEPTSEQTLVVFEGGDETQPNNRLYSLVLTTSNSLRYVAEEGAGNDITFDFEVGVQLGVWHLLTLVRTARGQVTLYVDGKAAGVASTALAVPDGGTTSTLQLGGTFEGWFGGALVANQASTPTQVATQWAQVSARLRPGRYQNMDASLVSGVQGEWAFEGDLTDDSGNAQTLQDAGNGLHVPRFGGVHGLQGVWFENIGSAVYNLERTSNDAALTIVGALTVHWLYFKAAEDDDNIYYAFFNSGELEADNVAYSWRDDSLIGGDPLRYGMENGAGSDVFFEFDHHQPEGAWHLHTLVRDSSGDVTAYCDGEVAGLQSSGLGAPTGGTAAMLQIAEDNSTGYLAGMIIANTEASAADVKRMWGHIQRGGSILPASAPTRIYRMRGFDTVLMDYRYWNASLLDSTGQEAPFDPSNLTDVLVAGIQPR